MLNGQKMSLRNVSPQWSGKHRFLLREEGILKAEMCLKTDKSGNYKLSRSAAPLGSCAVRFSLHLDPFFRN